jgi:hypothetical protein
MKNLLIILAFMPLSLFAQTFLVTPLGLRDAVDTSKVFVVIKIENKSAKQLYDNAIKYINKNYKSPDDVIKGKVDGEYLNFITHAPDFIAIKNSFVKSYFNADYIIELNFKDGKVKYEIKSLDIYNSSNYKLSFCGSGLNFFIYSKNFELKRPDAKSSIENYFNEQIQTLKIALEDNNQENNW